LFKRKTELNNTIWIHLGGYVYSIKENPWNWLTSKDAAEAMAMKVAEWPEKYNCDGIDIDLEDGAGNRFQLDFITFRNQLIKKIFLLTSVLIVF